MRKLVSIGGRYAFCLGLVLISARVQAADLFVSTQGNDSNPGTQAQPLRTITRAYSKAAPGVTINVLPGVYSDYTSGYGIHLGASGTAANPIVLKSQVRGKAIIDGQNASDRNQGFYIDGSYNVVDGFEIRNCTHGGISIWANNNRIINNEIHHNGNQASSSSNGQDGVYSNEGTSGNYYGCNSIHDNGRTGSNLDHGLYLCGRNETVINNLLFRNAATGLQVAGYSTVSNMKVYNNVVAWNGTTGIILWLSLNGVDIKNNIVYQNGNYGVGSYDAHGSGVVLDRNLIFGNGAGNYNFAGGGSDYTYSLGTTVSADPRFVNATSAGFDAHLGSGSPAIAAGLNLSSIFTTDLAGVARPASGAWDLGTYASGTVDAAPVVALASPLNGSGYSAPATIDIKASVNANGCTISGVQFYNGNTLLGSVATAPYAFKWANVSAGSYTLKALAVYDGGASVGSAAAVVSVSPSNSSSNQTIAATSGSVSAPFYATSDGMISQSANTSIIAGGRAVYTFTVPMAGDYLVSALVNAPTADNNSFYINIDAEPVEPEMIWDVPVTTGVTHRNISWRGLGTAETNQFSPKVFHLTAGTHQLIVRGREGNSQLGTISILANPENTPSVLLRASAQKGSIQLRWSTNYANYILQSRDVTLSTGSWEDVDSSPVIDQYDYTLSFPTSGAGRVYRLRRQ